MTDLHFSGGNNIAGNALVRYVPVVGLQSLPLPAPDGLPLGAPTFRTGYRFYQLYGTEATKSLSEEESMTDNGPVWAVKIELFLPGDSGAQRAALASLVRHRFVVEVEDNAGLTRRFGTLIEHLELSYAFGVPAAMGDRRGTRLQFTGNLTAPAPIVV